MEQQVGVVWMNFADLFFHSGPAGYSFSFFLIEIFLLFQLLRWDFKVRHRFSNLAIFGDFEHKLVGLSLVDVYFFWRDIGGEAYKLAIFKIERGKTFMKSLTFTIVFSFFKVKGAWSPTVISNIRAKPARKWKQNCNFITLKQKTVIFILSLKKFKNFWNSYERFLVWKKATLNFKANIWILFNPYPTEISKNLCLIQ